MAKQLHCPLCKQPVGVTLPVHEQPYRLRHDLARERRKVARLLRAQGYSIRQIQRICGWNSPRSAHKAVTA
jgi:DNA-binding transcriptional MerR regulator